MTQAIDDLPAILDVSTTVHSKNEDGHAERWGTQSLPPVSQAAPESVLVDLHFVVVAVHMDEAEHNAPRLVEILESHPEPERLAGGPDYIELGSWVGTPDYGLRLIALGAALGLWDAITPAVEDVVGEEADAAVEAGGIFMSGYPDGVAAAADVERPEPKENHFLQEAAPEYEQRLTAAEAAPEPATEDPGFREGFIDSTPDDITSEEE